MWVSHLIVLGESKLPGKQPEHGPGNGVQSRKGTELAAARFAQRGRTQAENWGKSITWWSQMAVGLKGLLLFSFNVGPGDKNKVLMLAKQVLC